MVCREQNIGCSSSRCTTATLRASVASGFCDSGQATGDFQLHMNNANDICCSTYETGGFKKRLTYVRQRVHFHLAEFVALLCALCFCPVYEGFAQTANQAQLAREQAPSPFPPTVPPSAVEGGHVVAAPGDADLGEQQILKRVEEYQP